MQQLTTFSTRNKLDICLAESVSKLLEQAINLKGQASIAVSGGSTPQGFFKLLSHCDIQWSKVTITLADERWVAIDSKDSNTRLVYENLLQNKASAAHFFHLKQGESLNDKTLNELNIAVNKGLLPLDVLILGMGEDGHTASLFPCSEQISQGLASDNNNALLSVLPKTAPYQRISFSFSALSQSKHIFLHLCGEQKQQVLTKALQGNDVFTMPIRAFLHHDTVKTQVYWAP
ncbi:6-phosphogluconolactonase [Colwellia ponticola]|uniref:6-phosphogluconolactonase n=1 Tax=Colwellia ponticola TaxID=2304625 RepID=A0A8H2JJL6_9GAMM|nr:6-phosphogluconolactonase [Colwellia ponticola]TMM43310.1 6-phosphogluconolactonase [Colwellia ponticola]